MLLQAASDAGLSVATSIIQGVLVALPFLLAAVRYLTNTEAWDDILNEGREDLGAPAGIIFSYAALYGAFVLSIIYVINNTTGLGLPLTLLAVFPITLLSLMLQPMVRAPESEQGQQVLVWFSIILMALITVLAVNMIQ